MDLENNIYDLYCPSESKADELVVYIFSNFNILIQLIMQIVLHSF